MPDRPTPTKWYHLVWMTPAGRRWFKIAGARGFCERAVRAACAAAGYRAEIVLVLPDRVHLLVQVPRDTPRKTIGPGLRKDVAAALAAAGRVPAGTPVWRDRGWCAALASSAGRVVVRRQLLRLARREWQTPELELLRRAEALHSSDSEKPMVRR